MIAIQYLNTPAGELLSGVYNGKLCILDWRYRKQRDAIDKRIQKGCKAAYVEQKVELHKEVETQLQQYFTAERRVFDLPLEFVGTDFQKCVWFALQQIPYGETKSYLELSQALGDPKAIRAVATANGANALSIVVPCHRIIGSKGELVGYAGGLAAKQKLLQLESPDLLSGL